MCLGRGGGRAQYRSRKKKAYTISTLPDIYNSMRDFKQHQFVGNRPQLATPLFVNS